MTTTLKGFPDKSGPGFVTVVSVGVAVEIKLQKNPVNIGEKDWGWCLVALILHCYQHVSIGRPDVLG